MQEAYFRIPDLFDIDKTLKSVALLLESYSLPESEHYKDQVRRYTVFRTSEHGYKYQVGVSNDSKIGEVDNKNRIYCIVQRYTQQEDLEEICKGICVLLKLEYLYDIKIENEIKKKVENSYIFKSYEKLDFLSRYKNIVMYSYFQYSRKFIKDFLIEKNYNESAILKNVIIRDELVEYILLSIQRDYPI